MTEVTVDIHEFDAFADLGEAAAEEMRVEIWRAVQDAADEGIREAQTHHPYTDRTFQLSGTAQASRVRGSKFEPSADMVWPAPYAGYVDEGTSRSRPYPFTPQAEAKADEVLAHKVEHAIDRFVSRIGG